jgi:putative tryptophan/tyrosine transport system substrate-binding protein
VIEMRRREFIAGLGVVAVWPLVAHAQQPALPVIGYLSSSSIATTRDLVAAFRRGLAEVGYIEDGNLAIEYRWAEDHYDRLPELAAELVRHQVAAIVVPGSTPGALVLKKATQTIPIVFLIGTDPVRTGLVASLNRPGGNLTGFRLLDTDIAAKRLQLLHEAVPTATTIALLVNQSNSAAAEAETKDMQVGAEILGLGLLVLNASSPSEIEAAFATLVHERAGALVVPGETFFTTQRARIVALTARHAVPAIFQYREFTEAGGLMSYGPNNVDAYRQVGIYVGRILRGEKPADLPVQQTTKIELVVNVKTAKALGLTMPETLLATADEVIQ